MDLKLHQRLFIEAWQHWRYGLALFGLGLLGVGLLIWQADWLSRVISAAFLDRAGLGQLSGLLWGLLAVTFGRAACTALADWASGLLAVRVKRDLRQRLAAHLLRLGPAFTRQERSGGLSALALSGVEALEAYYAQYLPQVILAVLAPVGILLVVFPRDLLSGVVLLVTAPLIPLFMVLIGSRADQLTRQQWTTLSRLSAFFLDSLQGLTTLKILGASRRRAQGIDQASQKYRQATMAVLRVTFLSALALELAATLSTAVVAVEIGLRLLYGRIEFVPALLILILAPEFYAPLRLLAQRFHAGMAGANAARQLYAVLDTPVDLAPHAMASPALPLHQPPQISFEDVSFSYEPGTPVLDGVSFTIAAGEHVALVGTSGTGKSTLFGLLLGFNRPQTGRILVNDLPFDDFSIDDWRSKLAWVGQPPFMFNDTLAANLRLAKPHASEPELWAAVRLAHLEELLASLLDGWHTSLGEGGARLSGGQVQRLALARAYVSQAPFLLLDEPSVHLDPQEQASFIASLRQLQAGRTTLIIAHHLQTARQADRVLVLEDGRIIEQGKPDTLLQHAGPFRQLMTAASDIPEEQAAALDQVRRSDILSTAARLPLSSSGDSQADTPGMPGSEVTWRLLSLLRPAVGQLALSVLLGAAAVGSSIGLLGTSAYLISAAALHPSIAELQVAIVGVRAFGLLRGVLRYLERLASHDANFRLLANLRGWFYRRIEPLAPAGLQHERSGDLLARAVDDINSLENFYIRVVAPPLVAVLVLGGMSLFTANMNLSLFGVLSVFWLLAGVGVPLLVHRFSRRVGRQVAAQRAGIQAHLVEGLQGMTELLVFNRQAAYQQRLVALEHRYSASQSRLSAANGLQSGLGVLFTGLAVLSCLAVGINLVQAGQLPGVLLAAMVLAVQASFEAVHPLGLAAQVHESSLASARRVFDLADREAPVTAPAAPAVIPEKPALTVRHLSFRYAPSRALTLDDISFELQPGQHLAIVGPNGSGKTTLLRLLLRLWDYHQGEIYLGDVEVRHGRAEEVRRCFGTATQAAYLFDATLRQNLLLARPGAPDSDLVQALGVAQLEAWLARQPQGLDTWVGEHGVRLSAGERRRLTVARAVLCDSPILLLDEPTANLDSPTADALMHALLAYARSRSLILITHRLIGLESMDQILVLAGGKIVDCGRHADLLAAGGLYRQWWLDNDPYQA